jgi:Fe-S-cluster-containing dehydrogenase component/formate-dependent nitrite reductase membrane component NrfD
MKYGFVIDNRKCIGCHACSTACKSENEVPLGVNRTWVKYTETGAYPDVTRHFQVTRCNHCENAPCARICPVSAMYQRDDGIVEFDKDVCIGCKACIQACPYDAIHIDPNFGTASKCHFCSHRIDIGLEPACVVVCPEHAIVAGDMDDPASEISKVLAKQNVTVRKPEQGTAPKLFYIEGHEASMTPTAADSQAFMWADVQNAEPDREPIKIAKGKAKSGVAIKKPGPQGRPANGIFSSGARLAEQMVQVGYNAQHKEYWHWQVPAYIVTKDIAAGIFLVLSMLLFLLPEFSLSDRSYALLTTVSLFFTLVTTALLVFDLEKPLRFLSILYRPQWRSWLTRGAYILVTFSLIITAWCGLEWANLLGYYTNDISYYRFDILTYFSPIAFGTAIYTAFLFGQAEGRDLWQSPILPIQLFVRSIICGCLPILLVVGATSINSTSVLSVTTAILAFSITANFLLSVVGEFAMPHQTDVAARAAHDITSGRYKKQFWIGYILVGNIAPLALGFSQGWSTTNSIICSILAITGIFVMEYIFVMAPQKVPNS